MTTAGRPRRPTGARSVAGAAGDRLRQARRVLRQGGVRAVAQRPLVALADRLRVAPPPPLEAGWLMAADVEHPRAGAPLPLEDGAPLTLNWVMTPPSRGSGGHATLMRVIAHLESRGHRCRIYLHDVYGNDARRVEPVLRALYPSVRASVHDLEETVADAHATVATSWPTAYIVQATPARGVRCYFVQDFEPWFHPRGSEYALSESTYRMGLHGVTAGVWLAERLRADYGMSADPFSFGSDTDTYHLLGPYDPARSRALCFFSRGGTPRRASELGLLAVQMVSEARPDVTVHTYGEAPRRLPFPAVQHGVVSPAELNRVYNRCGAGLSLSMTNVSLVPHEMLAAGCIPVVNDAEHNRVVLDNPHVRYADPDPRSLAAALLDVLDDPAPGPRAEQASASVRSSSWADAGDAVERSLRQAVVRALRPGA